MEHYCVTVFSWHDKVLLLEIDLAFSKATGTTVTTCEK